ncbi:MAG: hypothetical protein ACW99G_00295 [Candidatus Thorarchaeota archaeon]|jgi:hypothetical protein
MGATSVTGTGPGDAFPGIKGPGNERNIYVPLLTPHVVHAGIVTTATNAATVTFPEVLGGDKDNYVVMLTADNTTAAAHGVTAHTKTNDGDGNFASFSIRSENATETVMWMVVSGAVDAT